MKFQVRSSVFVLSAPAVKLLPSTVFPEFAFIGRSNVGKSSLINMLCGQRSLAHTSSTPGKTQLVNLFLVNGNIHFADLPGYGYARAGKEKKEDFEGIITSYLLDRKQLTCLFVLIDIRLPMQAIDLQFMKWLGEKEIPFALVFTKADKLSGSMIQKNVEAYSEKLLRWWEGLPGMFITSATKKTGRQELLDYIGEVSAKKKP